MCLCVSARSTSLSRERDIAVFHIAIFNFLSSLFLPSPPHPTHRTLSGNIPAGSNPRIHGYKCSPRGLHLIYHTYMGHSSHLLLVWAHGKRSRCEPLEVRQSSRGFFFKFSRARFSRDYEREFRESSSTSIFASIFGCKLAKFALANSRVRQTNTIFEVNEFGILKCSNATSCRT